LFRHSIPPTRRPSGSRKLVAALLLLVVWLSGPVSTWAQAWPPLDGVVADDTGRLDAVEINRAARDLEAQGVRPLAVFADTLPPGMSIEQYARAAVANYNMGTNGLPEADLFAVVVTLNPRERIILYGDRLKPIMEGPRSGGTLVSTISDNYLVPNLRDGDYTKAFAETLRQAAREIDLVRNPPPTATPPPALITNIDTGGLGNALLWCVFVVIGLGALAVFVPLLWRQWKRGQEAAARRRSLQDQLVQARNVAADMITDLDFPADPRGQIQYRFLALSLERERPEQLAQITEQYRQQYERVSQALQLYNNLSQSRPATEEQLTAAIAQYQQVQTEVKNAGEFLRRLAEQSRAVEAEIAAAPGETDAAKKAIAAATDEITRLAAAAPDLYTIQPERALEPAIDGMQEAERALQAQPPLSLRAYERASSARSIVGHVAGSVRSLSEAYARLGEQRAKLQQSRSQGFKLQAFDDRLAHALALLSEAARHLEAGDRGALDEALTDAAGVIQQIGSELDEAVALRASNEQALDQLRSAGDEVRRYIQEGAQAFDHVDEYAESSWEDIRGNGTEAQKAADHAFRLWQEATALNSLSPDSPQDFTGAQTRIHQANQLLDQARQLITAIMERLKNLQESQRIAQDEIATAERDVQTGRAFIAQHDPDVTPAPEAALRKAQELVSEASAEAQKAKPDWIKVVALARQANDMADESLADARSQQEAMQARRLKLRTIAQQAQASLSKASNFASVHRADISGAVVAAIADAQKRAEQGISMSNQAEREGMEDVRRAESLERAITALVAAQQSAESAYNEAATQFAAMEKLRQEAYSALQDAEETIRSVTDYIQSNQQVISQRSWQLLEQAEAAMPEWRDGTAETLRQIASRANQARQLAEEAYDGARNDIEAYNQRQTAEAMQAMIASAAIGSLLNAGSRRRSSGGWGGWGSGGSSGGGGGGGSLSGGWGGGGSLSGSWGGGGSHGGSWGGGGSHSGGW